MKSRVLVTLVGLGMLNIANAQLLHNRPDALVCTVAQTTADDEWAQFVFYVSGSRSDGSVLYKSLFSNPALITIDKEGNVSAPNLADCDKQDIQSLYDSGRAVNFGR